MIITSFLRVVYPLKYPSNACLSNLDNGSRDYCFWYLAMKYAIIKCHNVIGVLAVSRCLTKITLKYLSNIKAFLTCHCLIYRYPCTYTLSVAPTGQLV